jgi:hypothetical protein
VNRVHRTVSCPFAATIAAAAVSTSAAAQCGYVVEIVPDPCPDNSAIPAFRQLQDGDQGVGWMRICGSLSERAFHWTEGAFLQLPMPQGYGIQSTRALGIGRDGTIAGSGERPAAGDKLLVVWRTDGTVQVVVTEEHSLVARAVVRPDGMVLGEFNYSKSPRFSLRPFIVQDGTLQDVPGFLQEVGGGFSDVAESGAATGRWYVESSVVDAKPFLWFGGAKGEVVSLPTPPGSAYAMGVAVDSLGRIVIEGRKPPSPEGQPFTAYFWEAGLFESVLPPEGYTGVRPRDGNSVGQIVGVVQGGVPNNAPFLWQHGTTRRLTDLAVFSPLTTPSTVWAINDEGVIVCWGAAGRVVLMRPVGVVPADIDIDCRVGVHDLEEIFASWGATWPKDGNPLGVRGIRRADVNGDGTVDAFDLAEVLAAWSP